MILAYPGDDLSTATWIDLFDPTASEAERVRQATGLRVPDKKQISEIESTSRLGFEKGAYYVSTPLVGKLNGDEHELVSVGFVLTSRVLLTVRYGKLASFDEAHALCASAPPRNAEGAFLHILEAVIDRAADHLEHERAECDQLSRATFRQGATPTNSRRLQATLTRLGTVAEHTSLVRDGLLGIGRIATYIMDGGFEDAPTVNAGRMQGIHADVVSLKDFEEHLSNKIQFLLDATLGFINIEQNDIVKTLTIASVVGIPPVLVVGIYGMNFHGMPELSWRYGYLWALGLVVVSAILPLLWFKRRHWM
jgi:magnesium transporter